MSQRPPVRIADQPLAPESLMMSHGYRPELSEGAIKPPIFQTSTFVFRSAEEGKAFFELAYGLRERRVGEELGLIYSRLNNPNLEILEGRLALWDGAESCAVFESGMAAISATLLEFLRPGDVLLYSEPLYGGSDHFIRNVLTRYGIEAIGFEGDESTEQVVGRLRERGALGRVAVILVETPANPTNGLVDIEACAALARELSTPERRCVVMVDNTFLGPVWQQPLRQGADLVLYSATKYIGGHSDVIAGAVLGSAELIGRVRAMRTFTGAMAAPFTCWLLLRSLETLKLRMEASAAGAAVVADFLRTHPKVRRTSYLGHLEPGSRERAIYDRQCLGAGAMISFEVEGGEPAAFRLLNALQLVHLAVSLGGTESLAEHPATMTHADVSAEVKARLGIDAGLVRLSVGVERPADLIADLRQALDKV